MKYKKREDGVIEVYRNKRRPIRRVKEGRKNEDGCIACCLFDACLLYHNGEYSICEGMERQGVVVDLEKGDLFFIDVPAKD